jgi:hypothetical protein
VAHALQVEPVSLANSLLTGKLTGNFINLSRFGQILGPNLQAKSLTCSKIPYTNEQGIILHKQGI